MIRRPPRSTRTDTLFPYTTLFRSIHRRAEQAAANLIVIFVAQGRAARAPDADDLPRRVGEQIFGQAEQVAAIARQLDAAAFEPGETGATFGEHLLRHEINGDQPRGHLVELRSEERRVGKACVRKWRYRWSP